MTASPAVSVIAAVLNECDNIDDMLASLREQDYGGPLEVVIAEGGSGDGTRERLTQWARQWPALRVVDNPRQVQSHGLNVAAEAACGEILVRADGHTLYASDYVRRSVEVLLSSNAVAVGGNLTPEGRTPFGRAIATVLTTPVAIGPGAFHHARTVRSVDTVYLGAFRRADFRAAGGYRHLPSGVAEDADLYYRWRNAGREVLLDPDIRSVYRPRDGLLQFWRQSVKYGLGKAEFLWVEGRFPSWRPLAPLALVLGLVSGVLLAARRRPQTLAVSAGTWAGAVSSVVLRSDGDPAHRGCVGLATALLHIGYGVGLLWGLLRGPRRVRHLRGPRR